MTDDSTRVGQSGGVYVSGGTVNAQNIAGRDMHIGTQITHSQINEVFQPVEDVIRTATTDKQPEALQHLEHLKQEAEKGNQADHGRMTKLIDGILGLVPAALTSVAAAFGTPLLTGVAGPVTQFLLNKMLGR
jgi:hypothetical protein